LADEGAARVRLRVLGVGDGQHEAAHGLGRGLLVLVRGRRAVGAHAFELPRSSGGFAAALGGGRFGRGAQPPSEEYARTRISTMCNTSTGEAASWSPLWKQRVEPRLPDRTAEAPVPR